MSRYEKSTLILTLVLQWRTCSRCWRRGGAASCPSPSTNCTTRSTPGSDRSAQATAQQELKLTNNTVHCVPAGPALCHPEARPQPRPATGHCITLNSRHAADPPNPDLAHHAPCFVFHGLHPPHRAAPQLSGQLQPFVFQSVFHRTQSTPFHAYRRNGILKLWKLSNSLCLHCGVDSSRVVCAHTMLPSRGLRCQTGFQEQKLRYVKNAPC